MPLPPSVRWFLGYDLTEPLPDHSSLTRIRDRYGLEIFRRFFAGITTQCQTAGLIWARELYLDATQVTANSSLESLAPRCAVDTHLRNLNVGEARRPLKNFSMGMFLIIWSASGSISLWWSSDSDCWLAFPPSGDICTRP